MKNEDINKKPFTLEQLEEAIKEHGLSTGSDVARGVGLALNIAKSMLQKPVPLFEKGDIVHVLSFGIDSEFGVSREGIVEDVNSDFSVDVRLSYPTCIEVHPEKNTSFAKFSVRDGGFSQDRPKRKPKIGDWGWFWDNEDDVPKKKGCWYGMIEEIVEHGQYRCSNNYSYGNFSLENPTQKHD